MPPLNAASSEKQLPASSQTFSLEAGSCRFGWKLLFG
jgi:hypothetical protein